MKNTKEFHKVSYDLSDLQIMIIDGALVKITENSGSLLFFHFLPAISSDENSKFADNLVGKCVVELRMSKDTLNKIVHDIARNIASYEPEKTEIQTTKTSQKDAPATMFA